MAFHSRFPIDAAVIRGTVVDTNGNLTMDGEGLLAETLSAAQAARNSGGVVIVQARELVAAGSSTRAESASQASWWTPSSSNPTSRCPSRP